MEPEPLTEEELDELDEFLLDVDADNSMDLCMLDGFLTAVVSGPRAIMPSEWLPWVWDSERGEEGFQFKSQRQAERILGLILRHMNDIAHVLTYQPQDYEPLILENTLGEQPVPVIDEWCCGYMTGVRLDYAAWLPVLMSAEQPLSKVQLYGTEEGWAKLRQQEFSMAEHQAIASSLGDVARQVHAYWLRQRRG
jgi:uncharacterized protein